MNYGTWGKNSDNNRSEDEISYADSSRADPKRSLHWFGDDNDTGVFPTKRQALGTSTNFFTEILNSPIPPWSQSSNFQPIPCNFNERLSDPVVSRLGCPERRNTPVGNLDNLGGGSKMDESLFINNSSSDLSMYCPDTETQSTYRGLCNFKSNEVKDIDVLPRASLEQGYNTINLPLGLGYNKELERVMSSTGNGESENSFFASTGQPYNRLIENVPQYETYEQNHSILGMMQSFSKLDEKSTTMEHSYLNTDNSNNRRGESTIISFGGYQDDDNTCSARLLSSYDLFASQPAFQISEADHDNQLVGPSSQITSSTPVNISKWKDEIKTSKKATTNSFPSNVRSLLSTGMLDGVSVKYIAWSREKELCGIIKGSGYLCGCQSCNFSKVVNAYEFERHANCKTKHPNNHIYFENGKTIYGIVQELRSTPQNILFDVMQTITGSPINQKSFRLWKESFQAAARELQRIYGKD